MAEVEVNTILERCWSRLRPLYILLVDGLLEDTGCEKIIF